jgi:hypothetical protein
VLVVLRGRLLDPSRVRRDQKLDKTATLVVLFFRRLRDTLVYQKSACIFYFYYFKKKREYFDAESAHGVLSCQTTYEYIKNKYRLKYSIFF